MAGIANRAGVMIVSRMLNYAVMLFSPMVLVRIFAVEQYGQYREFTMYAMLFGHFIDFSIGGNLLYFIPRHPERARALIANTLLFLCGTYALGAAGILIFRAQLVAASSFDFTWYLLAYLFFFVVFNVLDCYWLAKKRTVPVLLYGIFKTAGVSVAVIVTAWVTRDVVAVVRMATAVQVVKAVFVVTYLVVTRSLGRGSLELAREQLRYVLPLGLGAVVLYASQNLGRVVISAKLGAALFAMYVIGATQVPIIGIVRQAVGDVMFPEMVERNQRQAGGGLELWQRATVVYALVIFPLFALLLFFARPFITLLFTEKYAASVPVFQVFLVLFLRQCFEPGTLLRAMNQNHFFVWSNLFGLALNLALLFPLLARWGIVGGAVAAVAADLAIAGTLFVAARRSYPVGWRGLLPWRRLGTVAGATLLAFPVVLPALATPWPPWLELPLFAAVYGVLYALLIHRRGLAEVNLLTARLRATAGRFLPSLGAKPASPAA